MESDKAVAAPNLGRLILKYRTINDLSQKDFGRLFLRKVSHASVSRWEKGKQLPGRDNLNNLAEIFDKSPDELSSLIEDSQLDIDKVDVPQHLKPDKHHFNLLKQGVKVWNRWREKHPNIIPQLAGLDLLRWSLDGINLSRADLRKARIRSSSLKNADFKRANLSEARFNTVCFDKSDFDDADLSQSYLERCDFNDVWLKRVNFTQAEIYSSKFSCSCLYQSRFDSAQLMSVDLGDANLNQTSWNKAYLSGINILGTSFEGVDWKDVEQKDIHMTWKNHVNIENLDFAPLIYIEQHNRPALERYIQERKIKLEAEAIVMELLNKYGSRPSERDPNLEKDEGVHSEGYIYPYFIVPGSNSICCSCVISEPHHINKKGEQLLLWYFVSKQPNSLEAGYIVRNENTTDLMNRHNKRSEYCVSSTKGIVCIKNEIASYDIHPLDLEDLKKFKTILTEQQTKQILEFIPIAKKIFRALHETRYQDLKYTLTRQEDDFVLRENCSEDSPIMDINCRDDVLTIRSSALETKHFLYFRKVLGKLGKIDNSFDIQNN